MCSGTCIVPEDFVKRLAPTVLMDAPELLDDDLNLVGFVRCAINVSWGWGGGKGLKGRERGGGKGREGVGEGELGDGTPFPCSLPPLSL